MDCHALQSKARNDGENAASKKVDSSSAQSVSKLGTSKASYQCLK